MIGSPEDPDGLSSDRPDPERALLERLDEEAVLELIEKHLDPVEQKVLWLRCFEKTPVDTITQVLGIEGPSGARAVLQRGGAGSCGPLWKHRNRRRLKTEADDETQVHRYR